MPMPEVWPYWVAQGYAGTSLYGTSGTQAYNVPAWNAWVQLEPQANITTATQVWDAWQTTAHMALNYYNKAWANWQQVGTGYIPVPLATPTPEIARQTIIRRNRSRSAQLRQRIAKRRAEALLLEHLNQAQREEWAKGRSFTVHTADGKRAYRIAYGLAGNIRLVEATEPPEKRGIPIRVGAKFCMHVYHPDGAVPLEDNVLAQKLLIESNEACFLELANIG